MQGRKLNTKVCYCVPYTFASITSPAQLFLGVLAKFAKSDC
jgi:hypothetical protein